MSTGDLKDNLPVKRRECSCGSERCLITQLSNLDRSLLPEIQSYRYRRCEACDLKYEIIFRGAVPTLEAVDSSASHDSEKSMGVEPTTAESPLPLKSAEPIGIAALCDYADSKDSSAASVEEVRRNSFSDRLWAAEATASYSAASGGDEDIVYPPDHVESLITVNSDKSGGSDNAFTSGGENCSVYSDEIAERPITLEIPLKGPDAPRICVKLSPYTITTVDLDTGRAATSKIVQTMMSTRAKGSKSQPTTPTNADRLPLRASVETLPPMSPQRKVTIRAKFIGCRKASRYNDGSDASPNASQTKQSPKANGISNQTNLSVRKTPSRSRAPESHAYKDNYAPPSRRSSVCQYVTPRIKQQMSDAAPNWSVDEMLSRSRSSNSRVGGPLVAGRSVSGNNSNSLVYMRPRPPWHPKRSEGRGSLYEASSSDVSSSVSRQRRAAAKGKAKSPTKLRRSESSSSLTDSVSNRSAASHCPPKVERKRAEISDAGENPKTAFNRLARGERIYCTFRGVVVPKSRPCAQPATGRVVESRDTCREHLTTRSPRRTPASSPFRMDHMYEEYVNVDSDSDDTCYASETSSNEDCSCERSAAAKCCANEVRSVITRDYGCDNRVATPPRCRSGRVQQYAQCCESEVCSPTSDSYECDCTCTKPSCGGTGASPPSIAIHVCHHCADQPNGTVCSAATYASANGCHSPGVSPGNPWQRRTPPSAPNVVYQYTNSGVVVDNY
ncbi:hypothetical protein, conserved [Babesia bigemina]|uniref:Uncharacterized protein n=1 Tax=Babesia bigemina TaxID=5866 RepID=A0A061DDY5_BABBI|nr:hypothetical protein, conserved [Babesia bigemina]CDR96695.1 hypothetical protein, conserved [Babesia bigemina]|eukprot:XP_012768881.1 hypothetical protein, conserved [Babesia bigemina]